MKKARRIAAMIAAMAMAATMVTPSLAFAEEITSGAIIINTEETTHAYKAFQIFDGKLDKDGSAVTFSDVIWGSGIKKTDGVPDKVDGTSIYQALFNLDIKKDNKNLFAKDGNPLETAREVAEALSNVSSNMPGITSFEDIDKIAAVLQKYTTESATATSGEYDADADADTDGAQPGYSIEITDPGYYLVIDDTTKELTEGQAYTKYILQVADKVTIKPKADAPSVMKKVQDDDFSNKDTVTLGGKDIELGEGYNDIADYSLGEVIPFQLTGTLPSSFDNYKGYYYKFTDTMGNGLTLLKADGKTAVVDNTIEASDFIVKVQDGTATFTLPATAYAVKKTSNVFEIVFNNLKAIDIDKDTEGDQVMSKDAIITVDYKAFLNKDAVIGNNGNPNEVKLTYSNDSNNSGNGEEDSTNETAPDYNVVFTYEIDVTKYLDDKEHTANATDGTKAGFKLKQGTKYATFEDNKFTGWVDDENAATEVFTTANGTFCFLGLQDGTYVLTETTVPAGYNKMADLTLVITADTNNSHAGTKDGQNYINNNSKTNSTAEVLGVGKALVKLEMTYAEETYTSADTADDKKYGIVRAEIINEKGSALPSTGGIGTLMFVLCGGVAAGIAGVYLVSKKKTREEEV